jgi:hypothetical protein
LPIDTALIPEEIIDQAPDKFIEEVIKRVKTVHDVARSNVELTQSKNKEYYDKKNKLPNFKVGDRVIIITVFCILNTLICCIVRWGPKVTWIFVRL